MTFEALFEDLTDLETRDGEKVKVVCLRYPHILCWFREFYWSGNRIQYKALGEAICGPRRLDEFRVGVLKKDWGIWEQLSQEQQTELEARGVIEENASRPGRKPKQETEVTEATEVSEVSEATEASEVVEPVIQKARTRKPNNPENALVPKKLHCQGCGKDLGTTPDQFRKQVEKSGLGKEEFISSYKCRSCRKEKETV